MKLLLAILLLMLALQRSLAASYTNITATTRVNICGNSLVETPAEDCEGTDLNNTSCIALGYAGGTLSCDISCAFDTFLCLSATPTPSLAPSVAVGEVGSPAPTLAPSVAVGEVGSPPIPPIIVTTLSTLPQKILSLMRQAGVDVLTQSPSAPLRSVLLLWVESWREQATTTCDINGDNDCNLVDISILLFYTDR